MSFTFKLARRWARLRLLGFPLAATAFHACGSGTATSPTEPASPDSSGGNPHDSPIQSVAITPDSVATRINEAVRFSATVRSSDGRPLRVPLEWRSTGGVLESEGVFRAPTPGTYRVIAAGPQGESADTAVVVVQENAPTPPGSGAYPNQPAGFRRIAEHAFGPGPLGSTALAGEWSNPGSPLYVHRNVPGAPQSGPDVLEFRWPRNTPAGVSPGRFTAWDRLDLRQATRYHELYISMRVRVLGT
ncbi:MAG TPA: hypothetical protein VNI61_01465, partial [Gemmatimonadales bacterium]|nr:hypothetical protein [Gemmatimonadales bacterium]